MRRLLYAGVRYRFATGLRAAMRLWGALLVAIAVARGLEVQIPQPEDLLSATAVVIACIALTAPFLPRRDVNLVPLPLSRRQRFAVDAAAIALFMLPPFAALVLSMTRVRLALPTLAICMLAILAQTVGAAGLAPPLDTRRGKPRRSNFYEFKWLFLFGGSRLATANLAAIAALTGAELAIRNNDVVHLAAIARIASLFAAAGAAFLAGEIMRARTLARPFRAIEAVLPLSPTAHLKSLLVTTCVTASPFLVAAALLRPIALPYAMATLVAMTLYGEHRSLRLRRVSDGAMVACGACAAILGALDARLAILVAIVLVPFAWTLAVTSDRVCDLPVRAEV